jgi:hypothetical protein
MGHERKRQAAKSSTMERQQVFSDPSHSTETDDTLGRVVSPLYTQVLSGNTADNAPAAPNSKKTIAFSIIATPMIFRILPLYTKQ